MIRKLLVTLLTFSLLASTSWAQTRTLQGTVTDAAGEALPGVNVIVRGTTTGTTTDSNGKYQLELPGSENALVFTFIGYKAATIDVGGRTVVDVVMEEDLTSLDEVVVVGYGTQREKDLTSAITTIKSEDISRTPAASAMQSLQGKVPGVQIVSSGAPGSSPTVRVRGVGSYPQVKGDQTPVGNEAPLYVVDGVFFDNIDFLNPNDIATISILKDASAAAIYGVRAANGVVLIETKSGKLNQKTRLTYDGYYGVQVAQNVLKMANSEQFATMAQESGSVADQTYILNAMQRYGRSRENPNVPNVNTDWYKEVLRPAPIQNHNLGVEGGSDKATYSLGASYFSQDGILDMQNSFERLNIRARTDFNVNDWITVGANFNMSNSTKYSPDDAVWNQAYFAVPIFPVYDEQNTAAFPIKFASAENIGYRGPQNPFPTMAFNNNRLQSRRVLANFYLKLDLIKDKLTFKSAYNSGSTFLRNREVDLPYFISTDGQRTISEVTKKNETYVNQIWDNVLTFDQTFGEHNVTVMAGTAFRDELYDMLTARGKGFPVTDEQSWYLAQSQEIPVTIDGAQARLVTDDGTHQYGFSYFGRIAYNYGDKYLLYGTFRADGSSKYQEKWGYFPTIGAGWVLSQENFLKGNSVVDFLKLRASWGKLGNDKVQASDGQATKSVITGVYGNSFVTGTYAKSTFAYLKWEVVEEVNVGLTSKFLGSRLSLEADYYVRNTENAVVPVNVPLIGGTVMQNVGVVQNAGLELALNWSDKIGDGIRYNVGFNMATLKNKATDLHGQPYIEGGSAEFRQRTYLNQPLQAFYGYRTDGVYQNQAQIEADPAAVAYNQANVSNPLVPGDLRFKDLNHDGVINASDREVIGSFLPKITWGVNLGASWKNFDLSVNLMGQNGAKILNRKRGELIWTTDGNLDADLAKNRWHGEGTSNKYPSAAGLRKGWNQKMSDYFVEKGDFFRIQNVQVGYTIKGNMLGTNFPDSRLSFTAERPLTVFKYNGFNPETPNGIDSQTYPIPAVYTVGLAVKF
ncbi:MAG TPA: TonB-dependent receptor [Chryseolinea sp.]